MKRLIRRRRRRLILVPDSLRAHHSMAMCWRLKEHADEIVAHDLLSSSPELNPDELLNADL
jgi:hypothetical protein